MRNWRFTRPSVSPLTTTVLAFAIAVAAHALFVFPDYRTPGDDTDSRASSVRTLNISALSAEQQKKFTDWLSVHDPARVARSNSVSGYSAVLPLQNHVDVAVRPYRTAEISNSVSLAAFEPVPTGKLPGKELPFREDFTGRKKMPRRVEIYDENGTKLPDVFGKLPAGWGSRLPTVITVTGFGKVSGVSITRSCGRSEMDRAAQAKVIRMNLNGSHVLTVVWPEVEK